MEKQHWEKEIEFDGMKFKLKKLNPFEFPAFKTTFAKATTDNDADGIAKSYEVMASWLLADITGTDTWIPVYSRGSGQFSVDTLNDPIKANKLLDIVLNDLILPIFLSSTE